MRELQNNFTTPEQSKRLLELGVPADSADCYYYDWDSDGKSPHVFDWYDRQIIDFGKRVSSTAKFPCWSVGRLMEIIDICEIDAKDEEYPTTKMIKDETNMDYIYYLFGTVRMMSHRLDFSKLEN